APIVGEPPSARQAINEMLDAGLLDGVMDQVDREGLRGHPIPLVYF
ncbi:MAG: hypothetical protein QOH50_5499, partial [Kribbellaceae bacterium]|nr:hypothetical protein [Kribbellaceae bacterium]